MNSFVKFSEIRVFSEYRVACDTLRVKGYALLTIFMPFAAGFWGFFSSLYPPKFCDKDLKGNLEENCGIWEFFFFFFWDRIFKAGLLFFGEAFFFGLNCCILVKLIKAKLWIFLFKFVLKGNEKGFLLIAFLAELKFLLIEFISLSNGNWSLD